MDRKWPTDAEWNDETLSDAEAEIKDQERPAKRKRNKVGKTKRQNDTNDDGRTSCEEALGNPLILNRIFSNLPTKFLLSSCSLVKKSWNTQARKFVWDHRICHVLDSGWKRGVDFIQEHHMMPPSYRTSKSVCKFLQQVDDLCCEITKAGRVIPYNSLEIFVESCRLNSEEDPEHDERLELKSQLKLKHLKITWRHRPDHADCNQHKCLKALLRQNCEELTRLELQRLSLKFESYFDDWFPQFPKLEELVFQNEPVVRWDQAPIQKEILSRIMDGAPKLNKLKANGIFVNEIVPEEKYPLLEAMEFNYCADMGEDQLEKLLARRPQLRELNVFGSISIIDRDGYRQSDHYLQQLLRDCHQSLETIFMYGLFPLGNFSLPPLINLTKLILASPLGSWDGYWTVLSSIDFERLMPLLDELHVKIRTTSSTTEVYKEVLLWPDPNESWNCGGIVPRCRSLKKLKLQVEAGKINFDYLKLVFPNVVSLAMKMDKNVALQQRDVMQLPDICEAWPELEELEIVGNYNYLERCYDSDFCGIHDDEVERLWRKDDGVFLESVVIVPTKPCLLTMRKLQRLLINFKFSDEELKPEDLADDLEERFVSNVARVLACRRIPHATISATFDARRMFSRIYQ